VRSRNHGCGVAASFLPVLSLLLCVLGLPHDWEGIYQLLSCQLVLRVLSFEDLQTVHSEPR